MMSVTRFSRARTMFLLPVTSFGTFATVALNKNLFDAPTLGIRSFYAALVELTASLPNGELGGMYRLPKRSKSSSR